MEGEIVLDEKFSLEYYFNYFIFHLIWHLLQLSNDSPPIEELFLMSRNEQMIGEHFDHLQTFVSSEILGFSVIMADWIVH